MNLTNNNQPKLTPANSREGYLVLAMIILLVAACSLQAQLGFNIPAPLNNNATNDTQIDVNAKLAGNGNGVWVAVWSGRDSGGQLGNDLDLFTARSSDDGVTWSSPRPLNINAATDQGSDLNPRIVASQNGVYIVAWDSNEDLSGTVGTDPDIFTSSSSDGGLNWSQPVALNANARSDSGWDKNPALAIDENGNVLAIWESTENLNGNIGSDQDILVSRSSDAGATWSAPAPLNTDATTDQRDDYLPTMGVDKTGQWVAAWASYGNRSDIQISRSTNLGASWSSPEGLHAAGSSDEGMDFSPSIACNEQGIWIVAWESGASLNGNISDDQDILYARSTDGASTWSTPAPLNSYANSGYELDANPSLATDNQGRWIAVWYGEGDLNGALGEDSDVFMTYSVDDGATWKASVSLTSHAARDNSGDTRPSVVTDGGGTWLATWGSNDDLNGTIGTDADILFSRLQNPLFWHTPAPLNSNANADAGSDFHPRLANDGAGHWVAVWRSNEDLNGAGTDLDIFVARSDDDGATWSAPQLLNSYGTADAAFDMNPIVVTDRTGTWVVAWDSGQNVNGTTGTDQDILMSRSLDNGQTWSAAAPLNANASNDPGFSDITPTLATDGNGRWIAAWQSDNNLGNTIGDDQDILVAFSTDQALTWSTPAPLSTRAGTDAGEDFDPRLATGGNGRWAAVWMSNDPHGNLEDDDDIIITLSDDGGASWSSPRALNSNAANDDAEDDDFAPAIAADGSGNWVVVWHSEGSLGNTIGTDTDILIAHSSDNAATWSKVQALNSNAGWDTGDDAFADISVDRNVNPGDFAPWMVTWTSQEPSLNTHRPVSGESQAVYAFSRDKGRTWSGPAQVHPIPTYAHVGQYSVRVLPNRSGQWLTAWAERSIVPSGDTDIYFSTAVLGTVNTAPVVEAGLDLFVRETSRARLTMANFFDPDAGDTHTAVVDWEDGNVEPVAIDPVTKELSASHEYDGNGIFTVTVTVQDSAGGIGSDQLIVAVTNIPPVVNAGPDKTATVGEFFVLDETTFFDRGTPGHSVEIDWGDGEFGPGFVDYSSLRIEADHVYNQAGVYTVVITIEDIGGDRSSDSLQVTVTASGPVLLPNADQTVAEGGTVHLAPARVILDNTFGPYATEIDWGDNSIEAAALDTLRGTISGQHYYPEDGTYHVTVTVTDGNGNSDSDQFVVRVINQAPIVATESDQIIAPGGLLTLNSTEFVDVGAQDSHTATVNWGDGSIETVNVDPGDNNVSANHTYSSEGPFTVTVTVQDDDGGTGTASFKVGTSALLITSCNVVDDQVTLQWQGGIGPFIVQKKRDLNGSAWDIAAIVDGTEITFNGTESAGFFRLADATFYDWGYPAGYTFGADGTVVHPNGFDGWPALHPANPNPGVAGNGGNGRPEGNGGNGGNGGVGFNSDAGHGGNGAGNGHGGNGGKVFGEGNGGHGGNGGEAGPIGGNGGDGGNADDLGNGGNGGNANGPAAAAGNGGKAGRNGGNGGNGGNAEGNGGLGGNGGDAPAGDGGQGGQGGQGGNDGNDGAAPGPRLDPNIVDEEKRSMICDEVKVVVVVNSDDDDQNGQEDRSDDPSGVEDNYAQLAFDVEGSGFVTVAAPQFLTGAPGDALGTRLRAFMDLNGTPFPFGKKLPTGEGENALILYLEGLSVSPEMDEIIFEYNYDDPTGVGLCSGYALVTAFKVETERTMSNREDRRRLRSFNKLLRDSRMTAKARVLPAFMEQQVTYTQEHKRGTFADRGFNNGWHRWRYTADSLHTWFRDENKEPTILTVIPKASPNCKIRVEEPLNVTIPHLLHLNTVTVRNRPAGATTARRGNTLVWTTEFFNVQRNTILLFDRRVDYIIQDQFGDPIVESARDGATVVIREDVPMVSQVPNGAHDNLQTWLDTMIANHTSKDWRAPGTEGEIHDRTTISLPVSTFSGNVGGATQFLSGAGGNIITMDAHVWHIGVKRNGSSTGTRAASHNPMQVYVHSVDPNNPNNIRIESQYLVFTWGPQ